MADTDKLRAHMARIAELRELDRQISETKKCNAQILEETESEMISMLEEAGLPNFRCDIGLVSVAHRKSVQTPKTPEDRAKFFEFLKEKGLFESMISVNSMTLNSFYRDEFERAVADGADDFKMPGIDNVTITPVLSFRRA